MATESFFDTYVIEKEDIPRFREIMTTKVELDLPKGDICEEVKGEELEALVKRLLKK